MALHIRSARADRLVRKLAATRGIGLTEAIELAVENELNKTDDFDERVRHLQDRMVALGSSGLKADKAFFDALSEE